MPNAVLERVLVFGHAQAAEELQEDSCIFSNTGAFLSAYPLRPYVNSNIFCTTPGTHRSLQGKPWPCRVMVPQRCRAAGQTFVIGPGNLQTRF